MQQSRRDFLQKTLLVGGLLTISEAKAESLFKKGDLTKISILHTNDVHSHIDPFDDNDPKYPGLGGIEKRATLINELRSENPNTLLLDAGDIFQGTPYFNIYGGELELKLMSKLKYDASTMGNHDFDNGLDGFLKVKHFAKFPFICSNYDFSETILKDKTIPYKIFYRDTIKVGIFGVGVELDGLVDEKLYDKTVYNEPIAVANKYAELLKNKENCDLVICLSHLGYEYEDEKVSDTILAQKTENIDLIIGGHTHTFLDKATEFKNLRGKKVLVNQVGWAGVRLGKVDFYFDKISKKHYQHRKQNNDYIYIL
jgi:5'-nucleotidase